MSGGNKRRRKKCRWNICHLGINVVQSFLGVSDSFEDIDASGASEALAIGSTSKPFMTDVFKKRSDFLNKDDYALYVRTHVQGK